MHLLDSRARQTALLLIGLMITGLGLVLAATSPATAAQTVGQVTGGVLHAVGASVGS